MPNSASTKLTTGNIPVKMEDVRPGESISINIKIPKLIERTLLPSLPPEIISEIKEKVKEQYKRLIMKDEVLSVREFEENIFNIDVAEIKLFPTKRVKDENRSAAGGFEIVTLTGLPNLVSFGQKCVEHFVQQGKVWRRLLDVTELEESSRYDIRVRVPLTTCPLESQIKIYELDEYYVNLNKTNGVWISSLGFGTELHYILGDMIEEKGFILLKVDDVSVQCLTDIKSVCNESTLMGNDSVDVTFRFPAADIDLSKIRGEYVIEKSHNNIESKDSNDGNTSPPPPSECDDPLSAYAQFATKFKAIPTIEFPGLCVVSVTTAMWNRHKSIYGPTCDAECPCSSNLNDICDTVRIDLRSNFTQPKTENGAPAGKVGFLDHFYKTYYPKIENEFPTLRPHEIYDKVIALWRYHQDNPTYGHSCHERCPCLNAWQSYFKKQLLLLQLKHHTAHTSQKRVNSLLRTSSKYSTLHDPNPTASDVAARSVGKNLKDIILKKSAKRHLTNEEKKKRVTFKEIEGDYEAPIPRGCVTQIDSTPVSYSTSEHDDVDSSCDKYSISSFFSRRKNSDPWSETREKKDAMRETHAWNPIEEPRFACSKCKVSKGKFLSCTLCGSCLNCGSKFQCDGSDNGHHKKGRLSSYDLLHLFRRRYDLALLAAFGFSIVKTVTLRDLSDRTVDKDADIFKVRNDGLSYYRDFSRAMELIDLAPGFLNLPLSSSAVEELVEIPGDFAKELSGRTILFAAVLHSTHDTVLHLLERGCDPRHRDGANKRASDVIKERREKLINRMKQIWNGEVNPMLGEEETLKAEIKDVEITSKLLQVYMTGERLVNLSSGVKCWSLVQVRILQAHSLCFSTQMFASPAPDLLFCAATWDGRQLNHISTVEPLTQSPDFSKSHPFQFRFNDEVKSTFKGKKLIVQLIKGDPNSRDNFQLSAWESSGEELNKTAEYKAISGTFALRSSPFLESGYLSVEIQRLPYDRQYEEKVKMTQSNELSGLIALVESLRSENIDLSINLQIPTANHLSLLHAAVYLENVDIVKRLLSLGAKPTSDLCGLSPLELSKSLNQRSPNKFNSDVLQALSSFIVSTQPSTRIIYDTAAGLHDAANSCNTKDEKGSGKSTSDSSLPMVGVAGEYNHGSKAIDSPAITVENSFLPSVLTADWMLSRVSKKERCPHFQKDGCDAGSLCPYAHVYCSTLSTSDNPPKSDELYNAYLNRFNIKLKMSDFHMLTGTGSDGNIYHTGALVCPISEVIYYAKGGEKGYRDGNDIYWYRSTRDAKVAVSSVVLRALDDQRNQQFNHDGLHVSAANVHESTPNISYFKESSPQDAIHVTDKGVPVVTTLSATTRSLPNLSNVEWMLEYAKKKAVCRYFNSFHGCDKKSRCYFAHIYAPRESQLEPCPLSLEKLSYAYDEFFKTKLTASSFYEKSLTDEGGKFWFLGGFICPVENTIYYARDGSNGHVNKQSVFLYPTLEDARAAVAGVVLDAFRMRGMVSKPKISFKEKNRLITTDGAPSANLSQTVSISQELKYDDHFHKEIGTKAFEADRTTLEAASRSSSISERPLCLPLLSKTEWMLKYPKGKACIAFSRNNACSHGKQCSYAHIYSGKNLHQPAAAVNNEALALAYRQKFQYNLLSDSHFLTKEERSSDGVEWFTAAFVCPVKEIIYLASGCEQGFCSSQGLFWYSTSKAAIGAASAVVVQALNEFNDFLPVLPNAHWMLDEIGAKHNCRFFNSNEGCPKGLHCLFAHNYVPKSTVPSIVPDSSYALWDAYNNIFGISLKNSSFYEKSAVDQRGKTWYTGALLCPVENTIYYAEGGKGWEVSEQNVFWYSSIKEARAAVSTVVLIAFSGRGYRCNWENIASTEMKSSNHPEEASESSSDGKVKRKVEPSKNEECAKKPRIEEEMKRNFSKAEIDLVKSLPLLKKVDWMLKYPKARQCFAFERDCNCLLGKNCGYGHVYRLKNLPSSDNAITYSELLKLYKAVFCVDLKDSDVLRKQEIDSIGKIWVTGCLVCPVEQTIYTAAGGKNGHQNSQGVYFYPSVEEMLDALAGVVFHVFSGRKEILPLLAEAEWMLDATKAVQACKYFPGCARTEKCHFAHIYRGHDPDPAQVIENDSLLKLYKLKFHRTLKNSDFYEKVAIDKIGRQLYTGALRCPIDRTIYYARGMGGIASTQNVYWYTSRKAAKTAVAAVVISALGREEFKGITATKTNPFITSCEPLDEDDVILPKASRCEAAFSSECNASLDSNVTADSERFTPEMSASPFSATCDHADDRDVILPIALQCETALSSELNVLLDSSIMADYQRSTPKRLDSPFISSCEPLDDGDVILPKAPQCEIGKSSESNVPVGSTLTEDSEYCTPKWPALPSSSSCEPQDDGDIILHKAHQCEIGKSSESDVPFGSTSAADSEYTTQKWSALPLTSSCEPQDHGDIILPKAHQCEIGKSSESNVPFGSTSTADSEYTTPKWPALPFTSSCEPQDDGDIILPKAHQCEIGKGSESNVPFSSTSTSDFETSTTKGSSSPFISSYEALDDGEIMHPIDIGWDSKPIDKKIMEYKSPGVDYASIVPLVILTEDSERSTQKRSASCFISSFEPLDDGDVMLPKAKQCMVNNSSESNSTFCFKRSLEGVFLENDSRKKIRMDESISKSSDSLLPKSSPSTSQLANRDSLPSNWMEEDFTGRCLEYMKYHKCSRGKACSNAHVFIPFSDVITRPPEFIGLSKFYKYVFEIPLDVQNIHCKLSIDFKGNTWFTTGFWCEVENVFYYAEGCPGGVKIPQTNVYWYPDEESANFALRAVIFTSFVERRFIIKKNLETCKPTSPTSISSSLGAPTTGHQQPSHEMLPTREKMIGSNFQNAYLKIFPKKCMNLPKSCFTYRKKEIGGSLYSTASFASPAENGALYHSCNTSQSVDGIVDEGRWWYTDSRDAKAAAFHCFLQAMVRRGIIRDVNHDKYGTFLF